ncbi:hypothetical protein PYCCODRAFT_1479701 [Trametes coccinea BRFM310]|uniref:Uncharacterized protein n=1 Tax=Trametes coccinea (strain BRFM310) TaxID=1353009 RepID=A0A1Y2IGJ4_TRAC3|nr:hypothetical protein PYCCODRAFT_1479701 [Trametes coccinea BRFM310]
MPTEPTAHDLTVTADRCFPRSVQTMDDLRRDIALLTLINTTFRGENKVSYAKSAFDSLSSDMRTKSAILDSISTLLASAGRATANAVTGQINSYCINLLCAYSEESALDTAETVIGEVPIDPVAGGRLLQSWWDIPELPKAECFGTHASQIGSILAYIWSRGDVRMDDNRDIYTAFSCFIARRARSVIVGRINYVKSIWDDCPFKTMRTWYKANEDAVPSSNVQFPYIQCTLADLLADHGLQPEADQSTNYELSSSNILSWLHVLEKTVNDISQAFGDTKIAPSREQTLRAHTAIQNLHTLLRSNLGDVLSKHDVRMILKSKYRGCDGLEQSIFGSGISEAVREGSSTPSCSLDPGVLRGPAALVQDGQDVEEHVSFDWQPERCENAVQHLFRCLATIPAWHRAIITILPSKAMPSRLCLFTFRHASNVDIGAKDASVFFRQYEPSLFERVSTADAWQLEAVKKRLNAVKKRFHLEVEQEDQGHIASRQVGRFSTVHPEAALMALAWAYSRGAAQSVSLESDVKLDAVLPTAGTVLIGISRQCCWCCDALRERLVEPSRGLGANVDADHWQLSLVLSGSHSLILPWLPPAGVPEGVLLSLREALFQTLDRWLYWPSPSLESFLRPGETLETLKREEEFGNYVFEQVQKYSKV